MSARLLVSMLLALGACGSEPQAERVPFRVTSSRGDLMYVWVDREGHFRDARRPDEIDPDRRAVVRVEPLGLDPARRAPPDVVYLADLRAVGPGGDYPVRVAPRSEFEAMGRTAPPPPLPQAPQVPATADPGGARRDAGTSPSPPSGSFPRVVVYGADWCGPCHQAERYLRSRGVPFVSRDIDRDPAARREMQAAMARVGLRPGSIPVVQIGSRLLVGFDARAMDRALAGEGGG